MEYYISSEYASDEDEIVSKEEDHVSIDSSSSTDEEIGTKDKFTGTMKSKDGKITKKSYMSAVDFNVVIF